MACGFGLVFRGNHRIQCERVSIPRIGPALLGLGFLVAAIAGGVSAAIAVRTGAEAATRPRSLGAALLLVATALSGLFMMLVGAGTAFLATFGFSRGRQLRRLGRVLLPRVVSGSTWAHTKVSVEAEMPIPREVAAQWRENGRTEHASVAAFARLTLDLMALGAPPHLIASSNTDGLDEIRHTELCFSLARSIDGRSEVRAPSPKRSAPAHSPGRARWDSRCSPSIRSSTVRCTKASRHVSSRNLPSAAK